MNRPDIVLSHVGLFVYDLPLMEDDVSMMRFVEAHARQLPGFKLREQWRSEMMQRMGLTNAASVPVE
jgi:hypothetical protein